ncbi:MAG: alkaline phosphatase family protein [Gemmataceae bacterium]
MTPLVVANTVGLTSEMLPWAPRLQRLADRGWVRPLREVLPAVTCPAQASMLTGHAPQVHGIVGNGWLHRDTMEVRFWHQSNRLIRAEPIYRIARRHREQVGRPFTCAKLFWWFNQGADVDWSITPKPYYGADGDKIFAISGRPSDLPVELERALGPFPFAAFWGPFAGLPSSLWIAQAAAWVLRQYRPDLLLVYVPHLDYDTQRYGPSPPVLARIVSELDRALEPLCDAVRDTGARLWIVNEYAHVPVQRPVYVNRWLRQKGYLAVRDGPFGEYLETFESRAFAVCDHQFAHVYVREPQELPALKEQLAQLPGIGKVWTRDEAATIELDHERAGDLIVQALPDTWFAYPYWLDDRRAPDFARTVDIHRKPGYDPCELLLDPQLAWPRLRLFWRVLQKRLGLRTLFDVIPLRAELIRGSHGLPASYDSQRPVFIADGPPPDEQVLPTTAVFRYVLRALIEDST